MAGVQKPRLKLKPGVLAAGRRAVLEHKDEARHGNEQEEVSRRNATLSAADHRPCAVPPKDIIQELQGPGVNASTSLSPNHTATGHGQPGSPDAGKVPKRQINPPLEDSRKLGDNPAEDTQPVPKPCLKFNPGVLAAGRRAVLELGAGTRRENDEEDVSTRNATSPGAIHLPSALTEDTLGVPQATDVEASASLSPHPTPVGYGLQSSLDAEKVMKSPVDRPSEDVRTGGHDSAEAAAFSPPPGLPEGPQPETPSPPVDGTQVATTFNAGRSATPVSVKRRHDGNPKGACSDQPHDLQDEPGVTGAMDDSSAPPTKMARFSGIKRCNQGFSALASADFTKLINRDGWSTLNSQDVTYCVLEEVCRAQHKRINNLVPRPRGKALKFMESRLQSFYLKSRMAIATYREPFVYKPPEAEYAVEALSEAHQALDKEIEELRQLQALMNDPKESSALLDKLASTVIPQPGLTQKCDQEVSPLLDAPYREVFSMFGEAYEILQAKAAAVAAYSRKSKLLLIEAAAIVKGANDKATATMQAPKTPHQLFSGLQDSVSPEEA